MFKTLLITTLLAMNTMAGTDIPVDYQDSYQIAYKIERDVIVEGTDYSIAALVKNGHIIEMEDWISVEVDGEAETIMIIDDVIEAINVK